MGILDTRGTPDKSKGKSFAKGNQLYKEIPYKWKSLIQGNPLHVETFVKSHALERTTPRNPW